MHIRKIMYALACLFPCATTAYAVTMDWVHVGDAGNSNDTHQVGYGAVAYDYQIGKYEVTNAQYVEFLNFAASTDSHGLYDENMTTSSHGGINRSGSSGSYVYSAKSGFAQKPVTFVSYYSVLRFANWMHNGQGSATTELGVYDMSQQTSNPSAIVRAPGATVWLPSENEWYKAAYYDPSGIYYDYATQTDTAPAAQNPPGGLNSANYDQVVNEPTTVGAYTGSLSAYGTYDQNGNVWEWNEELIGPERGLRGGSFHSHPNTLRAADRHSRDPLIGYNNVGFRLAYDETGWYPEGYEPIPEPVSIGLLVTALAGMAIRRK